MDMLSALRSQSMVRLIAIALMLLTLAAPAPAQPSPAPDIARRADELVRMIATESGEDALFAPSFLAQIPAVQLKALSAQLKAQHGAVQAVERIVRDSPTAARIDVGFARSVVSMTLTLEPQSPHRVIGLLVTGAATRGDSLPKLLDDFRALPGSASLEVRKLGTRPETIASHRPDEPMATGSAFKLYLLAELARAVGAGERAWSDVVPLGPPSLPSGISQQWPQGSPLTLHTLATLAISISDNSASDTLLSALGRGKVDAMVGRASPRAPARALPLLSTAEAFALKMSANGDLRARWATGTAGERRALLLAEHARLTRDRIDTVELAGAPLHIDSVEWFASANDMADLLDWLRRNGGRQALSIMAVSPGIAPGDAARWRYIGYKGGSETGVVAMSFLVQSRDGATWYAVSGCWNNRQAAVDNAAFNALMTRALNLIAP